MKTIFDMSVLAVLLAAASTPCFAFWSVGPVSKEQAKELGMEIRSKASGANAVCVELEFKPEGKLQKFSHVDLRVSESENVLVSAALREDRSKPGRVAVSLTSDRGQLDKVTLWVFVADAVPGGTIHELRVSDFLERDKTVGTGGEVGDVKQGQGVSGGGVALGERGGFNAGQGGLRSGRSSASSDLPAATPQPAVAPRRLLADLPLHIEHVSKARARELGMAIRSKASGTNAVGVELEFKTAGELLSFHPELFSHVELRIVEGENWRLRTSLPVKRPSPEQVVVGFHADRALLEKITLTVFVEPSEVSGHLGMGYELRLKDFVTLRE